jgi:Beta-propeller repeat
MRRFPDPSWSLCTIALVVAGASALQAMPDRAAGARISQVVSRLPLTFEANEGQVAGNVEFLCRAGGSTLLLTASAAVLTPRGTPAGDEVAPGVRMQLVGANAGARLVGEDLQSTRSNYFLGADPRRWHTGVAHYGRVRAREVYPGIDLIYHGDQRRLEYDLVVAPGADPRRIRLAFQGADRMTIGAGGELVVRTAAGELRQPAPVIYQETAGQRRRIEGRYVLLAPGRQTSRDGRHGAERLVGFVVGRYDRSRPLVIDPALVYSTFLGGNGANFGVAIAVDAAGSVYVAGSTNGTSFPGVTGASLQPANAGGNDVFVTKINPAGTAIVYSTFLGGSGNEGALGMAIDGAGNVYLVGSTTSTQFPGVTGSSIQPTHGGGLFDAAGDAIVYSTFLGGSGSDSARGIAVDAAGNAYVTGSSSSTTFPGVGSGSLQPANGGGEDVFVTKINPTGTAIVYSTFLGGSGDDYGYSIAVDAAGNAYVTGGTLSAAFPGVGAASLQPVNAGGEDAFVTKINPAGSAIVYSTFLGGSGDETSWHLAIDGAGSAYVTGTTTSTSFPGVTASSIQPANGGGTDGFVTKLDPTGTAIVYSTFLGGSAVDASYDVAVDAAGNAYVTGMTSSSTFPGVDGSSIQPANAGGPDAFVTQLDPAGSAILFSTFLGGTSGDAGNALAVDGAGNLYVTGTVNSTTFPGVGSGSIQPVRVGFPDAFVTKISLGSGFYPLPPCRVIDTRGAAGPLGAPALAAGARRTFDVAGTCGIPATARSLSVNVTVTQAAAAGNIRLFPAGTPAPSTSAMSFPASQSRGNNAVVRLAGASFTVELDAPAGTDFILDVNGYFK